MPKGIANETSVAFRNYLNNTGNAWGAHRLHLSGEGDRAAVEGVKYLIRDVSRALSQKIRNVGRHGFIFCGIISLYEIIKYFIM